MTTTTSRSRLNSGVARAASLCLLALAAVLLQGREARAQWTTSGANTTTTNNVGIGTASPTTGKLVISGTAGQTGLDMSSTDQYAEMRVIRNSLNAGDKDLFLQWQAGAGSKIHFFSNNAETMTMNAGSVGIGTQTPSSKLHIFSGTDASTSMLRLDTGVHGGTSFAVAGTANNESAFDMSVYRGGQYFSRVGVTNYGHVYLEPNTAEYGNVGIGTLYPQTKLHVVGDITVTGNINAKYQDVAEWVPTTQKLSVGTVVVLDKSKANHVAASTSAYDTRVAGVISEKPGLALGEAGEGKALVATTGRVKVKVDATRAPIEIGDLIVTSDVEGVAMKSVPVNIGGRQMHAPGTIIGKALESLDKGTGEILVLLSLQ